MVPSSSPDNAIVRKLCKIWLGKYSLAKAFWGFFVLGSIAVPFAAILVALPFKMIDVSNGTRVFFFICFAYRFVVAVGVWRSGTNYAEYFVKKGSPYSGKLLSGLAKFFVCLIVIGDFGKVAGISSHDVLNLIANAFKT